MQELEKSEHLLVEQLPKRKIEPQLVEHLDSQMLTEATQLEKSMRKNKGKRKKDSKKL